MHNGIYLTRIYSPINLDKFDYLDKHTLLMKGNFPNRINLVYPPVVVIFADVVCGHDNFRKNDQIMSKIQIPISDNV